MKLTKRIVCLMLALSLMVALSACGKKTEENKNNGTTTTTTQSTTTTTSDEWESNLGGDIVYNDGEFDWG